MDILKTLLRIPNTLANKLKVIGKKETRSFNGTVVKACEDYVNNYKGAKK